jgi:hypothetical protein
MNSNKKNKVRLSKEHRDKLGMDIPKDYFSKSKAEILKAVAEDKKPETKVIQLRPYVKYAVAASIVAILGLAILFKYGSGTTTQQVNTITNVEFANLESDDALLNSLLVTDENIDLYLDDYVMNEIVIKAQTSETDLNNIFINSLIINDSLLDNYIEERFIENIVL